MGSELHRFGFGDPDDDRWKAAVEKMLLAILTNPHLNIGDSNSEIVFPPQAAPRRGGGTTVTSAGGAFYGTYVDEDGDTYLQGGTVSGGDGTETIADIKIIDADTGVIRAAGDHMYVEATGSGVLADGMLVSGWNLSSATLGYNATVPSNTLPLAAGATGKKCYVSLGVFTADAFQPAASGNIGISYCPGSYTVTR